MPAQARRNVPTRQQLQAAVMLLGAVYSDQVETVATLLARGADPNIRVEEGLYPINLAASRGNLEIVRLLLARGANVTLHKPDGFCAIHMACGEGHLAIVKELIKAGASPNQRDDFNPYPLHFTARRGRVEILKELIRAGALLEAEDEDGYTALHHAAAADNVLALHELICAGSSHKWRNNDLQTPLTLACSSGHLASVKYLLDKAGADPGVSDAMGTTALTSACQRDHLAVVKVLLGHGISQLGPYAFRDAFCSVAMIGNFRMMRVLISAEGGVHAKGPEAQTPPPVITPLHYAAGYCHPFAMSLLLGAGANETIRDSSGKKPLDVVNTLRDENIGFGRRQARRMLAQAPAYRARSWMWPDTSATFAPTAGPAKNEAESAAGEAGARSAKVESEPAEKAVGRSGRTVARTVAEASAEAGKVGVARAEKVNVNVYRRPANSGGSAADGHPAVVASLIRYSGKK